MNKIINWFKETFPAKEFMLRSNEGMKYFRLGTIMQVILLSILVTSGCLVALFTYKMQFLQTVNYKQNLALKDLRTKYSKFTKAVVELRDELNVENSNFTGFQSIPLPTSTSLKLLFRFLFIDFISDNSPLSIS